MPRVVDTSVLYASFDRSDARHARAIRDLAAPDALILPREILTETIALIQRRAGFPAASAALDRLLSLDQVRVADPVPLEGAAAVFREGEGRLSLPDAVVVQTCRLLGATPLAYDRNIMGAV